MKEPCGVLPSTTEFDTYWLFLKGIIIDDAIMADPMGLQTPQYGCR